MSSSTESVSFNLEGKLALVTGASNGIGRHLAAVLADAGASVVLGARRQGALDEAANQLRADGATALGVAMDVADIESIGHAFTRIHQEFGKYPDILVNCAGIVLVKPFLEQTADDFDSVIGINLRGAFFVAQRAAAEMRRQGGGSIVNISSTAGVRPGGYLSSYSASKAGLIHLSKVMAYELARDKVRVNVVCPGNIETDMHRGFEEAGFTDALLKRIPQRRFGQCKDLGGAVLLLASEAGSYMTGSVVTVDGGQTVNSL